MAAMRSEAVAEQGNRSHSGAPASGRAKAVKSAICSPNTGHSTRSEEASPIEIGWLPRLSGCGRLGEVANGRFGAFQFAEPGYS